MKISPALSPRQVESAKDTVSLEQSKSEMWMYIAVVAGASIVALAGAGLYGIPAPTVHDEFSFLFAAETFARFRLANPSPPVPDAFFSPHILVEPTFSSKYPPAQGVALALGHVVGLPILGIWVVGVLAATGLFWCARARLSPQHALAVTAFFVVSVLFNGRWISSYWGGLVPFLGGSLVTGFFLRLRAGTPSTLASLGLGVGLATLALSRPFEGLVLFLVLVLLFADQTVHEGRKLPFRRLLRQATICGTIVGSALAFQAALNAAVTGRPFRMPHTEFHEQYMAAPLFRWEERSVPERANARLLAAEEWFAIPDSWFAHLAITLASVAASVQELGGFVLLGALLVSGILAVRHNQRLLAVVLIIPVIQSAANYVHFSHYYAPVAPLWFLLPGFAAARAARRWRLSGSTVIAAATAAAVISMLPAWLEEGRVTTTGTRDMIIAEFATSTPALVFVRYDEHVSPHLNVVYNDPDLQNPVLLANHLDREGNCKLVTHFANRNVKIITIMSFDQFVIEDEPFAPCGSVTAEGVADVSPAAFWEP